MSVDKPENLAEYEQWLEREASFNRGVVEGYYQLMASELRSKFESSLLWKTLIARMQDYNTEYSQLHGYPLFMNVQSRPELRTKPFESFLEKTFRVNARNSD